MPRRPGAGFGLAVTFATLACAQPAMAQRTFGTFARDLEHAGSDFLGIGTAPFHARSRDWLSTAAVLGVAAGVSPFDDDIDRWIVSHPDAAPVKGVKELREGAAMPRLGDLFLQKRIMKPMGIIYAVGFIADKPGIKDFASGCATSVLASGLIRTGLYQLVDRPRPSLHAVTADGDQYAFGVPGRGLEHQSFFGGHVANTMACATFWSHRYHLSVLEPALYTFAAGVGMARMVDRRHWTSDNVVGVAFGYAIGRTVARRSLQRKRDAARDREDDASCATAVSCNPDEGARGLVAAVRRGEPLLGTTGERALVGWDARF